MEILLYNHTSLERRSSIVFDKAQCGYLSVLTSTLRKVPALAKGRSGLVIYLMDACLFELSPTRLV